jgi:hypothetical protein
MLYSTSNYLAAEYESPTAGATGGLTAGAWIAVVAAVALIALIVVAGWRMFRKAGQPGWGFIIPFYNTYLMLKIAGRPGWWLVLFFIPFVNIAIAIVLAVDMAKSFGKGAAFGIFGLFFFSGVGYCILGYGQATYLGPAGDPPSPPSVPDQPYPAL